MAGRRSVGEARDTRTAIIDRAVAVASLEGLEGLTIGRLANDLQMSKAGVIGHFGSKEVLQLVALEEAVARFRREVWGKAESATPGRPRLLAICRAWAKYIGEPVFPGGCFITATSFEFDGRAGRVHDLVAEANTTWLKTLANEVRTAIEAGDLPARTDPMQVAFELNALAIGANQARQLHRDLRAASRCLQAMRRVLTPPGPAKARQ
jgi:AcrR family transcriptional regulator